MELLTGILCGIVLSLLFSFGPAFFGLIQNSIEHGFRRAMVFVLGVSLSDILVVFLMLTVLKNVDMIALVHNIYVASIGGVGIFLIGLSTFRRKAWQQPKSRNRIQIASNSDVHGWRLASNGFLLNILNPFIWVYWISIITFLSAEVELNVYQRYVFFAGMMLATLGCDLLKCRLASLLQDIFTPRLMNICNRVTGIILMAFGVYLIGAMIVYQTNPTAHENEPNPGTQSTRIIQQIHTHISRDSAKHSDTVLFK